MLNRNFRLDCESTCADQPQAAISQSSLALFSSSDLRTAAEQAKLVRKLQTARSGRTDFLSSNLFGEPAWDMLLELFASAVEQKRVTVGALCAASNVPQTTALRWIDVLLKENLVSRRSDPFDARRVHVELKPSACVAIRDYVQQLSRALRVV